MSVQEAFAAVNVEFHRYFNRSASSGLKPPLQESFGGQFIQVFVANAFDDFDFIHFAALGVYGKPETTSALGPVQYEAGRILGFDFFDQTGRRSCLYLCLQAAPLRLCRGQASLQRE